MAVLDQLDKVRIQVRDISKEGEDVEHNVKDSY